MSKHALKELQKQQEEHYYQYQSNNARSKYHMDEARECIRNGKSDEARVHITKAKKFDNIAQISLKAHESITSHIASVEEAKINNDIYRSASITTKLIKKTTFEMDDQRINEVTDTLNELVSRNKHHGDKLKIGSEAKDEEDIDETFSRLMAERDTEFEIVMPSVPMPASGFAFSDQGGGRSKSSQTVSGKKNAIRVKEGLKNDNSNQFVEDTGEPLGSEKQNVKVKKSAKPVIPSESVNGNKNNNNDDDDDYELLKKKLEERIRNLSMPSVANKPKESGTEKEKEKGNT